jgi:hypothetical protein
MCWITLTPRGNPGPHHHHHHPPPTHSTDGSSAAELVKVHHNTHRTRYSKVRIAAPSLIADDIHHHQQYHHHHPHLPHIHPLHMHPPHIHPGSLFPHHHHSHHHHHPFHLHGSGKKRSPSHHPAPPPSCASPQEPVFRTQIVEPKTDRVREVTRTALREVRPERRQRGRLRRVAGYEVLGRETPWDWDCVSSNVATSSPGSTANKGDSRSRYPPFGGMDRWM